MINVKFSIIKPLVFSLRELLMNIKRTLHGGFNG